MGGWYIQTSDGQESYLNLPMRNLMWVVLSDLDQSPSIGEAIVASACDPRDRCRGCPFADGFIFDGQRFREVMLEATEFLQTHPDWTSGQEFYGGQSSRQIALRLFEHLATLTGERIIFEGAFRVDAGVCPEGTYYAKPPTRWQEVPGYLVNVVVRWRNRLFVRD